MQASFTSAFGKKSYNPEDFLPEFSLFDGTSQEERQLEREVAQALRLRILNQSGFDSMGISAERLKRYN